MQDRAQPPYPHPKLLSYPKKLQQILEQRMAANEIPCLTENRMQLAREDCEICS